MNKLIKSIFIAAGILFTGISNAAVPTSQVLNDSTVPGTTAQAALNYLAGTIQASEPNIAGLRAIAGTAAASAIAVGGSNGGVFFLNSSDTTSGAVFSGHISGNVLTINGSPSSGTVAIGEQIANNSIPANVWIIGGSGSTWTLSQSLGTISSGNITADNGYNIYVDLFGHRWYRIYAGSAIYSSWAASSSYSDNSYAIEYGDTVAGVNGSFVISSGTLPILHNISLISTDIFQQGGILQPASGITISTNGYIVAQPQQIFDISLGGTILGTPIVSHAWPEWFGAVGGNPSVDSSIALNAVTVWLSQANVQGSTTPVGYATAELDFQDTVYFLQHTWNMLPFINYIGIRATTTNGTNPPTLLNTSRGTTIRALASLYTNTGTGIIINVTTGDITIQNLTVVGTAQVSSNPSIGFYWAANTSGVSYYNNTVYTCTKAHSFNGVGDTHFKSAREESNTVGMSFDSNSNDIFITDSVAFAESNYFTFANGVSATMQASNSEWIVTASQFIFQINDGISANINFTFGTGTALYAAPGGSGYAVDMRGSDLISSTTYKQYITFSGATINGLNIKYAISGTGDSNAANSVLDITGGTKLIGVTVDVITKSKFILDGAVLDNSTVDFSLGANMRLAQLNNNLISNVSGTAFNTNVNMDLSEIQNNTFTNVTTEIGNTANWGSAVGSRVSGNVTDSSNILPILLQAYPTATPSITGESYNNSGVVTIH